MITDEQLILYYYRDGQDADERARIGKALADSPELAQRLHRLVERLDAAAATPEVPVPAETMQRWRNALEVSARSQPNSCSNGFMKTETVAPAPNPSARQTVETATITQP